MTKHACLLSSHEPLYCMMFGHFMIFYKFLTVNLYNFSTLLLDVQDIFHI